MIGMRFVLIKFICIHKTLYIRYIQLEQPLYTEAATPHNYLYNGRAATLHRSCHSAQLFNQV